MAALETASPAVLSPEQLTFFHAQGYLPVEGIFTDDGLQPVIDQITAKLDEVAGEAVAAGRLSRDYAELDFEHRLAAINREDAQVASSLWNSRVVLPAFFELMRTPRLLDAVEQLVGPEIIASSVYRLRPKVPSHHQSPVPWHQDSGYFEPYCDKALVLTVWLPLVDATQENGCLWVKPRGHLAGGVVTHRQAQGQPYLEIAPDVLAATAGDEPMCVPIPKGGCLLLSNLTPHASFDNRSDIVRWSMDLRYQSADLPTNAPISRTPRQRDALAEAPVACYPPEADFLIRSRTRPHEVVQSAEEFMRLRREHVSRPVTNRWASTWD
jgi:phytanoyl-CoA hydroxylase